MRPRSSRVGTKVCVPSCRVRERVMSSDGAAFATAFGSPATRRGRSPWRKSVDGMSYRQGVDEDERAVPPPRVEDVIDVDDFRRRKTTTSFSPPPPSAPAPAAR